MQRSVPFRCAALVVIALTLSPAPRARAQTDDERAVVQTIYDLFDGMRDKDADKIRGVFAEGARLAGLNPQGVVNYTTADDFAIRIAEIAVTVDERIWDWEVRIDGDLAQLWTKYDVLVDGNFSHCGIDAFQLFLVHGQWKIFHLADTRHRENCWRYPGDR